MFFAYDKRNQHRFLVFPINWLLCHKPPRNNYLETLKRKECINKSADSMFLLHWITNIWFSGKLLLVSGGELAKKNTMQTNRQVYVLVYPVMRKKIEILWSLGDKSAMFLYNTIIKRLFFLKLAHWIWNPYSVIYFLKVNFKAKEQKNWNRMNIWCSYSGYPGSF